MPELTQTKRDREAVKKAERRKPAKKINPAEKVSSTDIVRTIKISELIPSGSEPQVRRRKHLKQAKIEELASSIEQQGLLHPIIVRPKNGKNEIVVGERRWLACKHLGLEEINCFEKNYSDAKVVEVQMQENLQRQDIDPLDEAFDYKYLLENTKSTIADIVARFGKTEKFIRQRLKLTELIPEALREIEEDFLPLGHALEMAKYPLESQQTIVSEQMAYRDGGKAAGGAKPLPEFISEIESRIVRLLKNAPFDTENPKLRIDGLICPNCPQRSKFEPVLFADDFDDDDRCLNQKCFEYKTNVDLRQKRDRIAAQLPNPEHKPFEEIRKTVPLVTDQSFAEKTPFKEKPLLNQKVFDQPTCEHCELSLIPGDSGGRKAREGYTCRNEACEVHHGETPATDDKLKKLEEEFELKVRITVRQKVFAEAIKSFDDNRPFWIYADLVEKLLAEFLFSKRSYLLGGFKDILTGWKNCPKNFDDSAKNEAFVKSLDERRKSQLLFLLTFSTLDFMSWRAEPQDGVKNLAFDYKVHYKLLDAETRLELAPEEFKARADLYLQYVRNGHAADIPHFWFDEDSRSPGVSAET